MSEASETSETSNEASETSEAFSRKPIRRIWVLRDQYVLGTRQYVSVLVNEYENGDLLEGTEKCQHVIEGNPYAWCPTCNTDLTRESCPHYTQEKVKRCLKKAWFVSKRYKHALCEDHRNW